MKGNLINWNNAETEFDLLNTEIIEETRESICVPVKPGNVVLATKRNFADQVDVCGKFHGKITAVNSAEEQTALIADLGNHQQCLVNCEIVHTGRVRVNQRSFLPRSGRGRRPILGRLVGCGHGGHLL